MGNNWLTNLLFFVAGLIIIGMSIKRAILNKKNNAKHINEAYWKREYTATFARKKEIPDSLFIHIDFEMYPMTEDPTCQGIYHKILSFKDRPLINLKGQKNIELKERYGMMQLEELSNYEQNYIEYMHTSCTYGKTLYAKGYFAEAQKVLEYIISLDCDLSPCFLTLATLYHTLGEDKALHQLKSLAKTNMQDSPYLHKVLQGIELQINDLHEREMLN